MSNNKELFENAPPYMIIRLFLKGGVYTNLYSCAAFDKTRWILWQICIIYIWISSQIYMKMGTNMNDTSDKYTEIIATHRNIMKTLNVTSDKYKWRWQQIYTYIVTNLNDIGDKSTWRWLKIHMNWLSFATPWTCRLKLPVTRTCWEINSIHQIIA